MSEDGKLYGVYGDTLKGQTRARRIARYLSQYSWYFPEQPQPYVSNLEDATSSDFKKPDLDAAWAYFEHIGLPRCFVKKEVVKKEDKKRYDRAEPGEDTKENPTALYPVWGSSITDMGDFGIGVGLYFTALKMFAIMTFMAGLINIPGLVSLNSDDYSPDGRQSLSSLLKVSAICTQMEWRPCPTCTEDDWNRFPSETVDRYANATDGSGLTYIKINDCKTDGMFGLSAYVSLLFVVVGVYVINYLQTLKATKFDEAEQTSSDYSIKIMNPPPSAKDPDDWKEFFENRSEFEAAKVNVVTIALDNERLIKTLVDRRTSLRTLENLLPVGMKLDLNNLELMADHCNVVSLWSKLLCCAKSPHRIVADIRKRDDEIVAFAKKTKPNFNVARVFVTFQTEKNQRGVFKALAVAKLKRKGVSENVKYQNTVLKVIEPDEPLSIRWSDLNSSVTRQMVERFLTLILLICLIVVGCLIIAWAESSGPKFTSFIIIVQSYLTPMIVGYLISFETHPDESSRTASRYLKITSFRWFITVIIPYYLTPFANTLDNGSLIERVEVLFIAELIQRPIMKAVGIFGIIYRHILGPRAVDQRRMNLWFSGDSYNIGERYTEITKIFFLALFYCILYPMAFFFASAIFAIYYWVDKFSILRSWKQGPKIGTAVSNMSMFFFKLCTLAYAIMAAYFYSQFPYDNACRSDDEDLSAYSTGSFNVMYRNSTEVTIQVTNATQAYKFCDQELIRSGSFPPLPTLQSDTWMDQSQEDFSSIFGWTSVAMLIIVLISLAYLLFMAFIYPLFFKAYKTRGDANDTEFGQVKEIAAYVPQVSIPGFAFPCLLCDDSSIEDNDVGWNDPYEEGYDSHNLVNDVRSVLEGREEVNIDAAIDALFSSVKSYIMEPVDFIDDDEVE